MATAAATPSGAAADPRWADDPAAFRIRFVNYNMANSGKFAQTSDLPGHLGPGTFEHVMQAPFVDGQPLDLAFFSLVETRTDLKEWAEAYNALGKDGSKQLDSVVALNAKRASAESSNSAMRGLVENLAAGYNGNLKTLLAFSSKAFAAEEGPDLHGRLPETTIMGVPIPNPKKAFTGSSVSALGERHPEEFRFIFAGAHFPIEKISEMFEQPGASGSQILQGAKIAVAKVLRKILRRASRRGMIDNSSLLILQGDLNSRTVLVDSGSGVVAADLLQEVLRDRSLQAAIQQNLAIPSGAWAEIVDIPPTGLPVTYKYHDEPGATYKRVEEALDVGEAIEGLRAGSWYPGKIEGVLGGNKYLVDWDDGDSDGRMQPRKNIRRPKVVDSADPPAVTIGDILEAANHGHVSELGPLGKGIDEGDSYKRILSAVPRDVLDGWGIVFKESSFRPFRFPASADRVIYWSPFGLGQRVSWELPEGGYKVLHSQAGSDHRPVTVEAVLHIKPPVEGGANFSFQFADESQQSSFLEAPLAAGDVFHEVCADDDKDSDGEFTAA